jgi:hypothetical protein
MTLALALTALAGLLLLAWAALDEPTVQARIATVAMLLLFGRPVRRGRHAGTPTRYVGRHWAISGNGSASGRDGWAQK